MSAASNARTIALMGGELASRMLTTDLGARGRTLALDGDSKIRIQLGLGEEDGRQKNEVGQRKVES